MWNCRDSQKWLSFLCASLKKMVVLHKSLANMAYTLYNIIKNNGNTIDFSEKEAHLWIIVM